MFEEELAFAHQLADRAAGIALGMFRRTGLQVERKPDRTLVTEADLAVEGMIRREIAAAYPDDGILGEEEGGTHEPQGRVWVIDPIDATANFARGVPIWAVLIALRVHGASVVGVAEAPARGERYAAAREQGATLNGTPIHVSEVDEIGQAHVLVAEMKTLLGGPDADAVRGLVDDSWRDRGFGDFWAHMLVAKGSAEMMLEPHLSLWDFAAPQVIVEEAGGRMTTFGGDPPVHGGTVVTTNGALHDEVLRRFGGSDGVRASASA
jgi:histidinol-phosphatase